MLRLAWGAGGESVAGVACWVGAADEDGRAGDIGCARHSRVEVVVVGAVAAAPGVEQDAPTDTLLRTTFPAGVTLRTSNRNKPPPAKVLYSTTSSALDPRRSSRG